MDRYSWLNDYLLHRPGTASDYKAEWGWQRFLVGGKLFAACCQPGPEHKGYDCRPLINLKCDPALGELLRSRYPDIIPGFYCDKRCWIAVFLDGEVPGDVLRGLCDQSYTLVFEKLTKKAQHDINAQEHTSA